MSDQPAEDAPAPRGRWKYDEATDTFEKVPLPPPKPEPKPVDDDSDHPGQYL